MGEEDRWFQEVVLGEEVEGRKRDLRFEVCGAQKLDSFLNVTWD